MSDIAGIKDIMGPPPPNLVRLEATRQNTRIMGDNEQVMARAPDTEGGPNVWTWYVLNTGPGILWVRWDGLGYAAVNDTYSITLPVGNAYRDIKAPALTFAAQGATTVTYTAENV